MRVLGVDPGTYAMGVGVVETTGNGLVLVHCGALTPDKSAPLHQRLFVLHGLIREVIQRWRPEEIAVEEPFVARNRHSAIAIGQAQAIAFIAAAEHDLPLAKYSPSQVKRSVTDYGGSSKGQVQDMVAVLLEQDYIPEPPDAADALAVAICHLNVCQVRLLTVRE